ncbi:MAG: hypothetical protein ACR2M5_07110 [Nakamurella sp.]
MDAEDLARALSAEPPTAAVRADAVQVIARSVASAKRRRARAAVAASIGAVVVVVAVVTGSIATFSGRAAPAPQPAQITTTMNVPTTKMTVPSRSTANGRPTTTTHPVRVTLQSIPSRSTASGSRTSTAQPARVTATSKVPSRSTATVGNAPTAVLSAPVGSSWTYLPTSVTAPSSVAFPTAATAQPPESTITTQQNATRTRRSPGPTSPPDGTGTSGATSTPTTTAQLTTSHPTVPQPAPPRPPSKTSIATTPKGASSSPATTAGSPTSFARFVGTYNHHTSFLVIHADHTGTINSTFGCCRGTTYPLRYSGGDNNSLQGTVTGPGKVEGTGGDVHLTVGQKIEFQFVTGQKGPIIQSSGFPPGSDQVWCNNMGGNYDNRCG